MKDSEILAEVEAAEKLVEKGWKFEACPLCLGKGYINRCTEPGGKIGVRLTETPLPETTCPYCRGLTGKWIKPDGVHLPFESRFPQTN